MIFLSTYGVVFLGTPHRGSQKTGLGIIAANACRAMLQDANTGILRSLEQDSEVLERIRDGFERMMTREKVKAYSFVEEIPTAGVGMVRVRLPCTNRGLMAGTGSRKAFGTNWKCTGGQRLHTCDPSRYEQVQQSPGDWLSESGRRDSGFCCALYWRGRYQRNLAREGGKYRVLRDTRS